MKEMSFSLPADQWFCSSFQDACSPSGGVWNLLEHCCSGWVSAGRSCASTVHGAGGRQSGGGLGQQLHRCRRASTAHHRFAWTGYSDLWNEFYSQDARLCVERVYAGGPFRRAVWSGQPVGGCIAMPVMFSALHGVPLSWPELQRILPPTCCPEATVQEVMICIFQDGDRLLDYQLAIGDQPSVAQAALEPWVEMASRPFRSASRRLESAGRLLCSGSLQDFLGRLDRSPLYLNDLATHARAIVEKWATELALANNLSSDNLFNMVNH